MSSGRLFLLIFVALLLPGAYASAGGSIPLIVTVAGPGDNCPGGLTGDLVVSGGSVGSCATTTAYIDGDSCTDPTTCIPLRVQLISNSKTLALDTRGTEGPRTLVVHFGTCTGSCASPTPRVPAGTDGNGDLTVPGLLEVLLRSSFTSIGTSQNGIAKFWFTDDSGLSWRIDWPSVQVTRVAVDEWEIVPLTDAGLSLLTGLRTKPGTIGTNGTYSIPFLLDATVK